MKNEVQRGNLPYDREVMLEKAPSCQERSLDYQTMPRGFNAATYLREPSNSK